ncbi:MAG: TIGR03663 family protein [Chloroflexi bacterium]|nr:TIGR03663 family protein [Chloroflexota bacterium]
MGQATPPAKGTLHVQSAHHAEHGTERHNPISPAPGDDSTDGNGRRSTSLSSNAVDRSYAPSPVSTSRLVAPVGITIEMALYALILVAAVLTRFWDLGSRALHHDESLHAYFSWLLATGQNYAHDPLMHGPFLFHMNALVYTLLGDSDASSRYSAALFGVILVALPILLRGERHLGRWGALSASALLVISPALLYQSRYIRHDIFTVAGSLFLFIAIMRYIERPARGWLIAIGASLGFLLTNHEIVFGIAAIFFGVIAGALLWGPLRVVAPVLVVAGVAALALVALLPDATGRPLPTIPWRSPSQSEQFAFYQDLLTHPLTIALILLAVVTLAGVALLLHRRRALDGTDEGWAPALFGNPPPGSIAAAVRAAWSDRAGLSAALIAGLVIFAVLFTTLFTNLYGLASGTIATDGTLLYWLGQHDFRRGEQPWFYYLLLFPQYEYIAVLFGVAATIVAGVRALLVGIGRATPGPRFVFQTFLAIWFSGIFVALSWAGEKMPWLIIHITLPATILAAALLGEVWERWRPVANAPHPHAWGEGKTPSPIATGEGRGEGTAPRWAALQWTLFGSLLALGVCWFLVAAPMTYGEFVSATVGGGWERVLTPWAREQWWLLALPPLAGIAAVALVWLRRGARLAAQPALAALVLGLALAQIHAGWRLVYQEGDVPKDMLVYTQTSPDMHRMVSELTTLSALTTGGRDLEIWYDDNNGVSWPMQWYLRDFPNRHLYGGTFAGPPDDVPVVLVGGDNRGSVEPYLEGYTAQEYVLRWWFPEDPVYRDFAIAPELPPGRSAWESSDQPHGPLDIVASIGESLSHLLTAEGQQGLYRLVMYRDLPVRIDSYDYTLYVRNDLIPLYNQIRY